MHARYMYFLPIGLDQQKKYKLKKNQLKIVNVFLSISLNIGFIVGIKKNHSYPQYMFQVKNKKIIIYFFFDYALLTGGLSPYFSWRETD